VFTSEITQKLLEWGAKYPPSVFWGGLCALVLVVLGLIVLWLRRLKRQGSMRLVWGLTAVLVVFTGEVALEAYRLPPPRAGVFELSHQLVRISVAAGLTSLSVCLMILAVPLILNRLERGDFLSFVAARHVRAKKSGFLTAISLLSILGVALSSFALCAVISIMGGFGVDLKTKILNNNANIRVESPDAGGFEYWREILDEVRLTKGVVAATATAGGEVMASSSTTTAGVQIRGVDVSSFGAVVDVPQNMEVGSFDYLADPLKLAVLPPDTPIGIGKGGEMFLKGPDPSYKELEDTDEEPDDIFPGVVLGRELARSLHAYVGDELTLVSPMGDLGPMGLLPRTRKFRVAGIFYTGMYEYDASHAYVALESAQELLDLSHFVTAVDIKVETVEDADLITPTIRSAIEREDLKVRDWKEMNRNLFSALQLEKLATFVILSIAILVASFCIICTLLLMVTEKSKEIAIMKAMGSSDQMILSLFMREGMLIGGVGTVLGVVTGFVSMASLEELGIRLDPEVYYIERLPVTVEFMDYLFIALCAFFITTLATVYPARAASRLSPVDGIRYE
jgi:lipoprotein-releasing system permease protein